ncbi:MAG: hypothetical protein E6127_21325, partial [Enterobacter sichuanensis]|uniref:hypothetical protein n=2 Tax=Enterobacter sichuanensis TaxID=2071710 RepID=UPI002907EE58
ETLRRFTAGPGHRCKSLILLKQRSSLQVKNYWGFLSPQGEGIDRGRNADFFSIPTRCLFLFTYPRAMLNTNLFHGFMIDVGIKEKQRQTARPGTRATYLASHDR